LKDRDWDIRFPTDCTSWLGHGLLWDLVRKAWSTFETDLAPVGEADALQQAKQHRAVFMVLCHQYSQGIYSSEVIADRLQSDIRYSSTPASHPWSAIELKRFRRKFRKSVEAFLGHVLRSILMTRWPRITALDKGFLDHVVGEEANRRLDLAMVWDMADNDW
jgi:hypothetical protein